MLDDALITAVLDVFLTQKSDEVEYLLEAINSSESLGGLLQKFIKRPASARLIATVISSSKGSSDRTQSSNGPSSSTVSSNSAAGRFKMWNKTDDSQPSTFNSQATPKGGFSTSLSARSDSPFGNRVPSASFSPSVAASSAPSTSRSGNQVPFYPTKQFSFRTNFFKGKGTNTPSTKNTQFHRTVTLLFNAEQSEKLSSNDKDIIKANKLTVQDVPLWKEMSPMEVMDTMYDIFSSKLDRSISFKFVEFKDQKFSEFNPPPGTLIDGAFLVRNTKTNIFLLPSTPIQVQMIEPDSNEGSCMSDTMDLGSDEDFFKPKPKRKRTVLRADSDDESFMPENGRIEKDCTPKELLNHLKARQEGIMMLRVSRATVLQDFEKYFPSNFSVLKMLNVSFIGEEGIDLGGLTREFLTLLLFHLKEDATIFEGPDNVKTLTLNRNSLKTNRYRLVGRVLQLTFLNNGPSPRFFSSHLYRLLCNNSINRNELCTDLILNKNLLNELQRLNNCPTAAACNDLLAAELEEYKTWVGSPHCVSTENFMLDKEELIKDVIEHYAIERIAKPLEQLKIGMNEETGFLDKVQKTPSDFESFFCFNAELELTARDFLSLFKMNPVSDEERIAAFRWEKFINDVEAGLSCVKLPQVLGWITGNTSLPAVAFDHQPQVTFMPGEYPKVVECLNWIKLPVDVDGGYAVFKETIENCVQQEEGFSTS